MKAYQKWALSLGIAAVTPGITMAGPFSIFNRSTQAARPAAAVDNQKLAEAVAQKLRVAKLAGFDIEIEVREGVCQLMGRIKDADQKQRASVVASQVAGITRIDNRLELINGQPAAASSQELPVARSKPGPAPIQTVQNPQPQRRVNLAGFFSRDSKPSAAINEQQVANRIAGAIGQSGVRGHSIDLKYKQGVAILSGVCGSRRDVARITEVVSQVPGVRQVDNRLQVAGMRPVSAPFTSIPAGPAVQQNSSGLPAGGNQAIAEQIAQALAANHLGGLDIEVRYNSGVCTLGGAVKHPQQAAWAAHVAQQVPGVQKIDNRLAVAAAPPIQPASFQQPGQPAGFQGGPPMVTPPMPGPAMNGQGHGGAGPSHLAYDLPNLPNYAWPSYASYPNSAQISYPTEYSASAWPYIGPFYPYPQVPMGWRDVRLSWDDGHWSLAFNSRTDKWFWFLDPKNW